MSKNWLIRTQSKQILGPVSREKIVELIDKKMLQDDDEICSGNGYWFYLKEVNLIDRYIVNQTPQHFNPVSEAKDVLNSDLGFNHLTNESEDNDHKPEDSATEQTMILSLAKADIPIELPTKTETESAAPADKKKSK